ncbi:holo-ACP synthase [Shouchella patagoniensis]|uniref:holo-ACP synthase n=1 Tax=Shouchella patagoniensis TaxID=228576 RepID=UPI000994FF74|nr:holo-ACP synthase [Shouchella patagoniensis]
MIKGIGFDLVDLKRIGESYRRGGDSFLRHLLSDEEKQLFSTFKTERRQVEWLSGRFAAKEAYSKARGTGFGGEIQLNEIAVLSDHIGKPCIQIVNKKNSQLDQVQCHVSITHTEQSAAAVVVLGGELNAS